MLLQYPHTVVKLICIHPEILLSPQNERIYYFLKILSASNLWWARENEKCIWVNDDGLNVRGFLYFYRNNPEAKCTILQRYLKTEKILQVSYLKPDTRNNSKFDWSAFHFHFSYDTLPTSSSE